MDVILRFLVEITREKFPWVYERGNKPSFADLYFRSACFVDRSETLLRRRSWKVYHFSHTYPYFHRKLEKRHGFEQANEYEVPFVGSLD